MQQPTKSYDAALRSQSEVQEVSRISAGHLSWFGFYVIVQQGFIVVVGPCADDLFAQIYNHSYKAISLQLPAFSQSPISQSHADIKLYGTSPPVPPRRLTSSRLLREASVWSCRAASDRTSSANYNNVTCGGNNFANTDQPTVAGANMPTSAAQSGTEAAYGNREVMLKSFRTCDTCASRTGPTRKGVSNSAVAMDHVCPSRELRLISSWPSSIARLEDCNPAQEAVVVGRNDYLHLNSSVSLMPKMF
ncbi:unnamed protein product [Protopolystoma xenopodis]|uniref:Uncharacterized protein n=1 Tax=Protopolystoma xenopodis TaxID=117903 RepID=A0A3S5C6Q6_9PLAT|nr:unnamed protein product [Protopolystoma xenopodis]